MDAVERIERSTAHAAKAVSGVKPDQLSAPTPCSDFDVKALLNHLFMGMHMLTTAAKTGKAEVLEGDLVGPDPASNTTRHETSSSRPSGSRACSTRTGRCPSPLCPVR
jgi:hypothetical protein